MDLPESFVVEKMVFGGQSLGRIDGKVLFAWDVLPGETARIATLIKKKKDFVECIAEPVGSTSPDRIIPREDHYRSCSPWQIMTPEAEHRYKIAIAQETYARLAGIPTAISTIATDGIEYEYRNKMEYALMETSDGKATLASFERGTHRIRPITPCLLPYESINQAAATVLAWMDAERLPARIFKSIILRGNRRGEVVAVLFSLDPVHPKTAPVFDANLIGIEVYFSRAESPASTPDKLLFAAGTRELTETVGGTPFLYGALSFFQVNLPLYERALADIKKHVPSNTPVVDFYGGTGSIGLSVADTASLTIVDSNEESITYAEKNIAARGKQNAHAIAAPAEKVTDYITSDVTLMLDPPRAGMHPKVVKKILEVQPSTIIYLSCNISTQARDLALLKEHYRIIETKLYNFFPRTPHIEGLVVLQK